MPDQVRHDEFRTFYGGINHKPVIKGTDHAIWRRIKLIPFNVTIPEVEIDRNLLAKLKEELPGILAWAVRGCQDWLRNGLGEPEEVKDATKSYRAEMDVLAQFLMECCVQDPSAKVTSRDLYQAYMNWCEENGELPLKQRTFGVQLKEKGFRTARFGAVARGWGGLGLMTQQPPLTHDDTSLQVFSDHLSYRGKTANMRQVVSTPSLCHEDSPLN